MTLKNSQKYDPIDVFPEEILVNILQYLGTADILKLSLVSKRWYDTIAKSKHAMKKISVKYCTKNHKKDATAILKSHRLYQNFNFQFRFNDNNKKAIQYNRLIINKFSASIVSIKTFHDVPRVFDLPKLKELEFCENYRKNSFIRGGLLSKAKSLEKMTMCWLDSRSVKFLKQSLKEMDTLKSLIIQNIPILSDAQDYKFKLETFKCGAFYQYRTELDDFLKAHSSSLKNIKYISVDYNKMVTFFTCFPKLRELRVEMYNSGYNSGPIETYPVNSTIESLYIYNQDISEIFSQRLKLILASLTNLKKLTLLILHGSVMLNTILSSSSLKTVEFFDLTGLTEKEYVFVFKNQQIKFSYMIGGF